MHFHVFLESNNSQLFKLSPEILEQIINIPKLKLINEDQLLSFINQLYINDPNYTYLYNYVHFLNVESSSIKEFSEIFDINDISNETWRSLSLRLMQQMKTNHNKIQKNMKIATFSKDDQKYSNLNRTINFEES